MSKRTEQIGQQIQQILSEEIQCGLKDPRVGFATVVAVDVSADLQHAKVRISVLGDATQRKETMAGIEHARGYLRRQVADELSHLRFIPDLHFVLDTSLDYSIHIDAVLRRAEDERREAERQASETRPPEMP